MFWNNDYGLPSFFFSISLSFKSEMKAILRFCENQFQII